MWLFTPFGFYSVVRDRTGKKLMIRTRIRADLDRLRKLYLPSLSATKDTPLADYPHRAFASPKAFGAALRAFAQDIDYRNFKDEVERVLGLARELQCHTVHGVMSRPPVAPIGLLSDGKPVAARVGKFPLSAKKRSALATPSEPRQFRIVSRSDWKKLLPPGTTSRVKLDRLLTPTEWLRFTLGFKPDSMDDKWFIFQEGHRLFLHRSWTGRCCYVVHLEPRVDGVYVVGAEVSRDSRSSRAGNEENEVARMCHLIEFFLLDLHRPYGQDTAGQIARDWGYGPHPETALGRRPRKTLKTTLVGKRPAGTTGPKESSRRSL